MSKKALSANFGSTTVKPVLYEVDDVSEKVLIEGSADLTKRVMTIRSDSEKIEIPNIQTHSDAMRAFYETLQTKRIALPGKGDIVVYKAVLAGDFDDVHEVTPEFLAALETFRPANPIHCEAYGLGMALMKWLSPDAAHVAVMEPHLFRNMPKWANTVPVPLEDREALKIRRYGFHGASHHSMIRTVDDILHEHHPMISYHGGGSASLFGTDANGNACYHTMGLTPEEGTVMGTRGGNWMPYATARYIQDRKSLTTAQLDAYMIKNCGLKALCGTESIKDIYTDSVDPAENARRLEARAFLEHDVAMQIGFLDVAVGGVKTLVFTGGAGQGAHGLREGIMKILAQNPKWSPVFIPDYDSNKAAKIGFDAKNGELPYIMLTKPSSYIHAYAIATDEGRIVVRMAYDFMKNKG